MKKIILEFDRSYQIISLSDTRKDCPKQKKNALNKHARAFFIIIYVQIEKYIQIKIALNDHELYTTTDKRVKSVLNGF